MAVKTLYVAAGNDGNFGALVDGTAQAAASRTDGWTVAKIAATNYAEFDAGTKQASGAFNSTLKPASFLTGTTANAFKTPAALIGTFAATAWTFTFAARCTLASAQQGRIRLRVFKSKNADGSAAVELTGATVVGTIGAVTSTSVDTALPVTWSPGTTIRLDNEFLFFVVAWEITTVAGSNSADVVLRTGSTGPAGSRLVTPDFTANAQWFGTFALPFTFSRSVAGQVVVNPITTTPIDDFNRADGKVYAGTGAGIWLTNHVDSAAVTNLNVIGNQLGTTAAYYWAITKNVVAGVDCDLIIDCAATGVGGFGVSMTNTGTAAWNGITVGYDTGSSAWWATAYTAGSGGSYGGQAASAPQAGDSFWLARRGAALNLYRSVGGGPWALIASWAGLPTSAPHNGGAFAVTANDTSLRWDNLRGGPLQAPATTYYGAFSAPFAFGQTISGTRKTFSSLARPFTFSTDVRGVRKAFGQINRPFVFGQTIQGFRTTFRSVRSADTVRAGVWRAGQLIPITLAVTEYGSVTATWAFGQAVGAAPRVTAKSSLSSQFTFSRDVRGVRKTFGVVARPFVFIPSISGIKVGGPQTYYGQVSSAFVFSRAIAGQRKTFGQITRPFVVTISISGDLKSGGVVLNTASNVYLGGTHANSVYAGANKVWPP